MINIENNSNNNIINIEDWKYDFYFALSDEQKNVILDIDEEIKILAKLGFDGYLTNYIKTELSGKLKQNKIAKVAKIIEFAASSVPGVKNIALSALTQFPENKTIAKMFFKAFIEGNSLNSEELKSVLDQIDQNHPQIIEENYISRSTKNKLLSTAVLFYQSSLREGKLANNEIKKVIFIAEEAGNSEDWGNPKLIFDGVDLFTLLLEKDLLVKEEDIQKAIFLADRLGKCTYKHIENNEESIGTRYKFMEKGASLFTLLLEKNLLVKVEDIQKAIFTAEKVTAMRYKMVCSRFNFFQYFGNFSLYNILLEKNLIAFKDIRTL